MLRFAALAVLAAATGTAQPDSPHVFEVASVKPTLPDSRNPLGFFTYPGGRVAGYHCTLEYLIELAFDVQSYQVIGGPRWIREDHWDIAAKPPASSDAARSNPRISKLPPNPEQRRMLQALLGDRFELQYHRESRESRVFLLERARPDPKLTPAKNPDEYPWAGSVAGGAISGDGLRGENVSMAELARRLGPYFDHPVTDATGLEGSFDFRYEYHAVDAQPDPVSTIDASLRALGLKLTQARRPLETIIIDSAAKPSAN